ncbi:MAG: hypothetical protein JRN52_14995 [Nitrososphaerota archaeon]|nr:hypothetical protein [Nitrososphaerota archaeon]
MTARRAVIGSIAAILILTVLEFPPPIGFETRPQADVSPFWFVFFILILMVEIATIPLIYKSVKLGAMLGILASVLNVIQVIADQVHLMQPEVAPLGYSLLEVTVLVASIALAYFSLIALLYSRKFPSTTLQREKTIPA